MRSRQITRYKKLTKESKNCGFAPQQTTGRTDIYSPCKSEPARECALLADVNFECADAFASKLAPTGMCTGYRVAARRETGERSNFRHKKPRSFDQGLCYRLEVAQLAFFVAPRRSVGLGADMAQRTGLEPATPGVTGRYSNRLNYRCASVEALSAYLLLSQVSRGVVGDDGIEPPTFCL